MEKNNDIKPIEEVMFSWSDNKMVGFCFMVSIPIICMIRRGIGIRMLKVGQAFMLAGIMMVIAALGAWINQAPFSRTRFDFMAWKIFIAVFLIVFTGHLISAYRETKRKKVFTYTRSMGYSILFVWWRRLGIPFVKKEQSFQNAVEPVFVFVCSRMIAYFIAPNLGLFLSLSAICLFVVNWQIRSNRLSVIYDRNDSIQLSQAVTDEVNDEKQMSISFAEDAMDNKPHELGEDEFI